MAELGDPDVRWEHYSHQQIWDMVHQGPGGTGSSYVDPLLDEVSASLSDAGDLVNAAVQKANAGDTWSGSAATSASDAMSTLRDFDDVTHGHSVSTYTSTVGQAGLSSHARGAVPPVQTRGMRTVSLTPDGILANTSNLSAQDSAARQAQEQAREVMRAYTEQSSERVGALPTIAPTPKVVFRRGDSTAGVVSRPGTSSGVPKPTGGTAPSSSSAPDAESPTRVRPEPSSTTPSNTKAPSQAARPGDQPQTPITHDQPQSTGTTSWRAPTGEGPVSGGRGARRFNGPSPEGPGSVGKRTPGSVSGPGELGERGEATAPGRGGNRGAALMGGAAGGRREDDEEHRSRYGLPSDTYFDDNDPRDPANREFYVAPDVIE